MDLDENDPHFLEELIIIIVLCIIGALLIFIIVYCIAKKYRMRRNTQATSDFDNDDEEGNNAPGHHVVFKPPPSYVEVMTTDRYPTPEVARAKNLPLYLSSSSIHSTFYSSHPSLSPSTVQEESEQPPTYEDATKFSDSHEVMPT